MSRAICYIDGFNLYHGIREDAKAKPYRWLDLRALAERSLLPGKEHALEKVVYFTSIPPWDAAKARRHQTYIDALELRQVEVVLGRFQDDQKECRATCRELFSFYSEKLTDVNLATRLLVDGVEDRFDCAYVISGDADQAPALHALKRLRPSKQVYMLFPPRRRSMDLQHAADRSEQLGWKAFRDCQLPEVIQDGRRFIRRPNKWAEQVVTSAGE